MGVQLKKIVTQDQDLKQVQDYVSDTLGQIQTGPFFGGNIITATLTAGTDNVINHKLSKTPQAWVICDITATADPSISGTVSLSPNPYTPAGTVSGSTFTGTAQSFSEGFSGSVSVPAIRRTAWDENSLTLRCGENCTVKIWVS